MSMDVLEPLKRGHLLSVTNKLLSGNTGDFYAWDGEEIPW